jgi:hypothetical protein
MTRANATPPRARMESVSPRRLRMEPCARLMATCACTHFAIRESVTATGGHIKCTADGNDCTDDSCHPETGCDGPRPPAVLKIGALCEVAGNKCTIARCDSSGICVAEGVQEMCPDDNNPCTDDTCSEQLGCSLRTLLPQGTPCSCGIDSCRKAVCDGVGSCDCSPLPDGTACDSDANPCSAQTCQGGSCFTDNTPLHGTPCNSDGNVCTTEICDRGNCATTETVVCPSDGNPCTDDACHPTTACESPRVPVGDGLECITDNDLCTEQVCSGGVCTTATRVSSCTPDDNDCTFDLNSCDPTVGCHAPMADEMPCGTDICQTSLCQAGVCTLTFVSQDETPCDTDVDRCTVEACLGGECLSFGELSCPDDGSSCTTDECHPERGCEGQPFERATNEGLPCQVPGGLACATFTCVGGYCGEATNMCGPSDSG